MREVEGPEGLRRLGVSTAAGLEWRKLAWCWSHRAVRSREVIRGETLSQARGRWALPESGSR